METETLKVEEIEAPKVATRGRKPFQKRKDFLSARERILAPEPEPAKQPDQTQDPMGKSLALTPEEQAIYNRVAQGDDSWQTIGEESAVDFSLSQDPFAIPSPAKKLEEEKKFRFRWITRTPQRLDEIKNKPVPFRWWVVNSVQPVGGVFSPFIDPNNGCVSREDQMLMFKPWWMHMKEREYKDRLAEGAFAKTDNKKSVDDMEISGGSRSRLGKKSAMREEIHGGDVVMGGEDGTEMGVAPMESAET